MNIPLHLVGSSGSELPILYSFNSNLVTHTCARALENTHSGKKRRSSFGGIFNCMLKEGTFSPEQPGTPLSRAGSGGGTTSGKKQKATSTSKPMEKAARAADARRDLENVRFRL